MSIFGFNVLTLQDRTKLYARARAMNPAAMLFYSQMGGTAQEFAAEFPNCATILRHWPDGEVHKRETPEAWLNRCSGGIPESIYLYTTNEAGWSTELIKWHVDLMRLCITRKRRLCILSMGAGQPQPDDWKSAKELITLASQHDDLFIISLHQYAGGVITSGLIGGDPTRIQPSTWPKSAETKDMTRWHVGRQKFLYDQCKAWGIAPPRVVITEAGFDFLGDIGGWLSKLEFTPPNNTINGWHTLIKQWRKWWPEWDAETAYAKQMIWAADTLWNDVEAVLLFGWGDSGGWSAYDVSKADSLLTQLEAYNPMPIITPPPPYVIIPADKSDAEPFTIVTGCVLQANASLDIKCFVGSLTPGERVTVYRKPRENADGLIWHYYERTSTPVGESPNGWASHVLPPPDPIIIPPPSTAEGDIRLVAAKYSMIETLEAEIEVLKSEIHEILSKWYTSMAA